MDVLVGVFVGVTGVEVSVAVGVCVGVAVAAKMYKGEQPLFRLTVRPKVEAETGRGLLFME